MIADKMQNELNDQLNAELYSAYLYFSMSGYFESKNLRGFAHWMRVQAMEEMTHMKKFYDYIVERGGVAIMKKLDAPPYEWSSNEDAFKDALKHERYITARINKLFDLGSKTKDFATVAFLNWFVTEQVEEEASVDEILQKFKLIGSSTNELFLLDKDLGARLFNNSALVTI